MTTDHVMSAAEDNVAEDNIAEDNSVTDNVRITRDTNQSHGRLRTRRRRC